jgi:hypothetical protein
MFFDWFGIEHKSDMGIENIEFCNFLLVSGKIA